MPLISPYRRHCFRAEKSSDINDRDFSFWEQSLVVEDSDYIIDNADLVRSFIEERLSSKG